MTTSTETRTLPDGSPLPSTRAELLSVQATQTAEKSSAAFSARRGLLALPWALLGASSGAFLVPGLRGDTAVAGRLGLLLVAALLATVAAARLVRHARESRRLRREVHAWMAADRTAAARALPAGDLEEAQLTPYDVRDRADLGRIASRARTEALLRVNRFPLLYTSLGLPLVWFVGLLLLLAAGLEAETAPARAGLVVSGTFVLLPASVALGATFAEGWRRQQHLNAVGLEAELYLRRQAMLSGRPADAQHLPRGPRWVAAAVVGVLVVLLLARIATASATASAIAAGLLLLGAAVVAVPLARRRALHVVPLLGDGSTVVEAPSRRVELTVEGDRLVVRPARGAGATSVEVPLSQVAALVPVDLRYPFAPPAVALLTPGTPVVLAGSGVRNHPAITTAQDLVGGHTTLRE